MADPTSQASLHSSHAERGRSWYHRAILYEVDVKAFHDANGDGIGDFAGLTAKLDYLVDLGIDCIWLQPFYPSPDRDNGYDVTDYCDVDPRLGTLADFDAFVVAARSRGIRLLADLPLNHTSDRHGWFKAAREDRESPYRHYYIWRDRKPENDAPYPVFGDEQDGNWKYDGAAGQFYFHTFYPFMPDVNMGNPRLREELLDVCRFWIKRGVSGFRLDALPFLVKERADGEELDDPKQFLRDLRRAIDEIDPESFLIAEVNLVPDRLVHYFGDGDQVHMLLNFYLCNHMFLALATGDSTEIVRAWEELPDVPDDCGWGNFVRNHDELNLSRLTEAEKQAVFNAFGPEPDVQLWGRGIRRRFAPMLDGDQRRIRLMYSLLLSLPGTPVINMGEELGLGDDLSLEGREAARTPMQWRGDAANGGFSDAPRERLHRPVITGGPYGYETLNVADAERDERSLLNFFRRAIAAYRSTSSFATGEWTFVDVGDRAVLAHHCDCPEDRVFAVHNISDEPKTFAMRLPDALDEILADGPYAMPTAGNVTLRPYGFRWFRARQPVR